MSTGIQTFTANLAFVEIVCPDGNSISTKHRKKDIIPKRIGMDFLRAPPRCYSCAVAAM